MKIYENLEMEKISVIYYSVSEEKYSVSEAKPDTQKMTEYSVYQNIQNNSVQLYSWTLVGHAMENGDDD